MKRKCRKTHESILSKGRGTVILAVCMATAMFALTACGGEQTGPAGSSGNEGTGNPANSDAVSSGVDVANKESEEFHEEKGDAELPQPYAKYMEILEQIMTEGHDSNGREYDWNEPWNFEDNCFAILDVDNDGRQELLFNFNETCMADKYEVVYEYDEEADILREELATWISTDYYSNGIVKVDESHNHGKDPTGRGGGPYTIYQYDEERDSYQLLYSVDSWDGQIYEENFPDELDVDGDKLLYYVMVEEAGAVGNISGTMSAGVYVSARSGDMIIFDGEEYSAWVEELMPEWSRIDVVYHRMTEDFMERVQSAYVQAAAYAAQADKWFVEWQGCYVSDDYLLYDLDGDGDLELTVSVMQGSGRYSYNYFYDLDDNGKVTELELVKLCDSKAWECGYPRDFDIGYWPSIQAYQDDNGIIYYEGNDYCREGILGGYYENGFYYLKDGVVYQDSIRRMESFHKVDGQENETHYYSISLDENGAAIDEKEVTEEQYEAIREEYIKEMAEIKAYQNWIYFGRDEMAQGEISEETICRKLFESALGSEFCLCNAYTKGVSIDHEVIDESDNVGYIVHLSKDRKSLEFEWNDSNGQDKCLNQTIRKLIEEHSDFFRISIDLLTGECIKIDEVAFEKIIQQILEENQDSINIFFEKYPKGLRWIQLSCFDFTKDGCKEIILSKEYVETSAVVSHNYVYDCCGNKLLEFVSEDITSMEIYYDEDNRLYYLENKLHISAHNDMTLYEEIAVSENMEMTISFIEWDARDGRARADNQEDGYFVFDSFTKYEEQAIWEQDMDGILEILNKKEAKGTNEKIKQYVSKLEQLKKSKVEPYGSMYDWEIGMKLAE